ncbi:MAG: hypothetical protein HGGPFJEG_02564 [Ignavibacteria bacterium]|nr:hypothetical protein [Ignavibacteria bacterium]
MHAFINREILSRSQGGDNRSYGSVFENIEAKQNAINSLISKVIRKEKNIFTETVSKPNGYSLSQNYPNPFNPSTKISYTIPKEGFVTLKIYDVLGKEVMTIVNETKQAGFYEIEFNGESIASGFYLYRLAVSLSNPLEAGDPSVSSGHGFIDVKRMILLK